MRKVREIFPRASDGFVELNEDKFNREPSGAIPERSSSPRALAKKKVKDIDSGKCLVSITSYRVRLCDPDNCVGKWHLDSLRYARIIHDDRPEDIIYQINQKKVKTKKEEKTLIEITIP